MKQDKDACDIQIGCVLLQKQQDEMTRPSGYWSHSLTSAECVYDTTQREYLATEWTVPLPRLYRESTRFANKTDYSSLKWILNKSSACGRFVR